MISIDFSFDTKYGTFSDSILLPEDHTFTETEIETMKQQRLENWICVVETPSGAVDGE